MRSVLITGAGSGIGYATALELGRAGMFVIAVGRRAEPLQAVVSEIIANGGSARQSRSTFAMRTQSREPLTSRPRHAGQSMC